RPRVVRHRASSRGQRRGRRRSGLRRCCRSWHPIHGGRGEYVETLPNPPGAARQLSTSVVRMTLDATRRAGGGTLLRRWPLVSGIVAVSLAAALGLVAAMRYGNLPFAFDREWMAEVVDEHVIWLDVPARLMDWLGGGWFGIIVVPVGIVVVLCIMRRFWDAAFFGLSALLSVALVQALKA